MSENKNKENKNNNNENKNLKNNNNRNPFRNNKNRKRIIVWRNGGRNINRGRKFIRNNNQNVIKYNRPKNVIQRSLNQNNKNSIIRGKDLIISTNNELVNQNSGVYAIIPINPLYWQGTRIKNMALQYQYYIPKTLSIEYVPTVSKFQPGTITIGCISNQIINQETIQQTLISSTSGESFSCSEFYKKNIALGSLLQQKKLLLSSDINKESVPFYIVVYLNGVIVDGSLIAPGSIYVNYSFEFFNPITETLFYKTENSIMIKDIDVKQQNITIMLTEQNGQYGVGTKVDVEVNNGAIVFKYNNSDIQLDSNLFCNAFYASHPDFARDIFFDLSTFIHTTVQVTPSVSNGNYLLVLNSQTDLFKIYYKISSDLGLAVEADKYYKVLTSSLALVEALQNANFELLGLESQDGILEMLGKFKDVNFINQH